MAFIRAMFFDLYGTLGIIDPDSFRLTPFPDTIGLLRALKMLDLRLGIAARLPRQFAQRQLAAMLEEAGMGGIFEPNAIVARQVRDSESVFLQAAAAFSLPVEACVFVGQDIEQVTAALGAGMHVIQKAARFEILNSTMQEWLGSLG